MVSLESVLDRYNASQLFELSRIAMKKAPLDPKIKKQILISYDEKRSI